MHYLVLINAIDCLAELFGNVLVPQAVDRELRHPATPPAVRAWLDTAPAWLECRAVATDPDGERRGGGERAAIELSLSVDAQLLLIDDRAGTAAARARGLHTTGTIGVLVRAWQSDLLDLRTAFLRLRETNFRCRPEMFEAVLIRYRT